MNTAQKLSSWLRNARSKGTLGWRLTTYKPETLMQAFWRNNPAFLMHGVWCQAVSNSLIRLLWLVECLFDSAKSRGSIELSPANPDTMHATVYKLIIIKHESAFSTGYRRVYSTLHSAVVHLPSNYKEQSLFRTAQKGKKWGAKNVKWLYTLLCLP